MLASDHPHAVLIAGPNGAGKSTLAPSLLLREFGIRTFVNADVVAQGLAGFDPAAAAIQAGKFVRRWMDSLRESRTSFALETTLSGRALLQTLGELHGDGYESHLVYLWVPDVDAVVERVRQRVALGGHDVPEQDIRRRYLRSIYNFEHLYRRAVTTWQVYHAFRSAAGYDPPLIAWGTGEMIEELADPEAWSEMQAKAAATKEG